MTTYKYLGTSILRLSDMAVIPQDPVNTDYAEYLDWVKAGNTTLPAAIVPPQPNVAGFIQATKSVIGLTKIDANPTLSNYANWVFNALQLGQWADAQTLIITANTALIISPEEYAAIKSAVMQFNLPIILP